MTTVLLFALTCVAMAAADYDCVCSYNVEEVVYAAPSDVATTVGYLYEFDCKEQIPAVSLSTAWLSIAFDHQQGYVHTNGAVQIQKCQGMPPSEDTVTTMASTSTIDDTIMPSTISYTPSINTTTTIATVKPVTTTTSAFSNTTTITRGATQSLTTASPSSITYKLLSTQQSTITNPTQTTTNPNPATHRLSTTSQNPFTTTLQLITFTQTPDTTTLKPTTLTPKSTITTTTPSTFTPQPTTTTTTPTTVTPQPTTTTTTQSTVTPQPTTTTTTPTTVTPTPNITTTITTRMPATSTPNPTSTQKQLTLLPTSPRPTVLSSTVPSSNSPCYNVYRQYSSNIKGTLTSYGQSCYEFVTDTLLWSAAEYDCRAKGGHLAHIATAQEQNLIYNFLNGHNNHTVWIGLHDHTNEEQFQWISGQPITYTHWSPNRYSVNHPNQNCVELDPSDSGFWKDKDCDTINAVHYGYICQYGDSGIVLPQTNAPTTPPASTTHAPVIQTTAPHYAGPDGYTSLCPLNQRLHAQKYGSILAQYGGTCYELMPNQKMTWQHSETLCESGGGHLVHITSAAEQAFIQSFMMRHSPMENAWIGLHDLNYEGFYQWSSGDRVSYTHILPTHLSNYYNQVYEDCFLIMPSQGGYWDDISCGRTDGYYDYDFVYPPLCQYRIPSSSFPGTLIG